jgi:prepilin-type N-terminal cleavage/methylation domain-containing protein
MFLGVFSVPLSCSLHKNKRAGLTLIELIVVVAIIGILSAVAIPQYARYRRSALNALAQSAYHDVAVAQENYYVNKGEYCNNYTYLVSDAGLVIQPDILYGPITLVLSTDPPSFTFSLNHKSSNSTTYTYSNDGGEMVQTDGPRVTLNDSTVP